MAMSRTRTFSRLTRSQRAPPSVLLNMPEAPANTVLPAASTASAATLGLVRPQFAAVQLAPASSLLKMPTVVPTYTVFVEEGSTASACILADGKPEPEAVQLPAPSMLL